MFVSHKFCLHRISTENVSFTTIFVQKTVPLLRLLGTLFITRSFIKRFLTQREVREAYSGTNQGIIAPGFPTRKTLEGNGTPKKKRKTSSQNIPKLMNREFMDEILDCSLPFCIIESLQYEDKSVGNDGRFLPELGGINLDPPESVKSRANIISKWWSFLPNSQQNHGFAWGRWVSVLGFHTQFLDEFADHQFKKKKRHQKNRLKAVDSRFYKCWLRCFWTWTRWWQLIFFYFHPDPWGRWTHFDGCIFFRWVGSATN